VWFNMQLLSYVTSIAQREATFETIARCINKYREGKSHHTHRMQTLLYACHAPDARIEFSMT